MRNGTGRDLLPPEQSQKIFDALHADMAGAYHRAQDGVLEASRGPCVVIKSAEQKDAGLVVVWYGHFRVRCTPQSGSEWGQHHVSVKETTFDADARITAERVVGTRNDHLTERWLEDYDDDTAAESVAGAIIKA